MLIRDFYADREIFITGGSGFLGKSLIEKLLRECRKVKAVYYLMRGKRELSAQQRLEELKKNEIFDIIRQECPEVLDKLHAIDGDSMKLGLGIKPQDLELIKNVSIIFHMAANVKFDNPFRNSILINTRGTYELVKIAEKLKNLVVFLHCSTAYCNPFLDVLDEKVHKMEADWRTTIKIAETYDDNILNTLFLKYTGFYPNNYTFTKNLSEQIIQEYSDKLPMHIFRPSMVLNSFKEPVEGYIDNMYGPLAAMVALSLGVTPLVPCNANLSLDTVPVDLVSRLTLVATYKRGMQTLNKQPKPRLEVVNCAAGKLYTVSMAQGAALYNRATNKNPMENTIWSYDVPRTTPSTILFLLYFFFLNIPTSIVIDIILRLIGQKPQMLQIQRRLFYTLKVTHYFSNKQFEVINENSLNLEESVPLPERTAFGYKAFLDQVDVVGYFETVLVGVKKYLFNQPMQASNGAMKRYRILKFINRTIKFIVFILVIKYLWSVVSVL